MSSLPKTHFPTISTIVLIHRKKEKVSNRHEMEQSERKSYRGGKINQILLQREHIVS